LSELPNLDAYSTEELARARTWPAIERYISLIERVDNGTAKVRDEKDALRIRRHRIWVRATLATCLDKASAADVCTFWSREAEDIVKEAWRLCGLSERPMALLALGKLGAEELNLSSDVDLIVVRQDGYEPEPARLREFQSILSDLTEFGFCLRVDFTLRPGGRAASAVPSVSEFENHYGYHGEMWERLAYVRMRVLAGPAALVEEIERFSRKFSFRRHLDYTLFDDLKALRAKIRAEKFESRPGVFHLKLGEGGIRDLELFVHALQVIHGGRNHILQTHSTDLAIRKIRELALLPEADCDFLLRTYWHLRDLENRLQGYDDQQGYLVDMDNGHPSLPDGFQVELRSECPRVSEIARSLLGDEVDSSELPRSLDEQQSWLAEGGFSKESLEETWPALLAATALSRKSERDERARMTFLQGFVEKLAENKLDRDLGLSLLLDFVKAVRAKASFFTLLNRETRVRDALATLFSISPYLGSLLASRPELIDGFIFRKQAPPPEDIDALLEDLAERRLLAELIAANQYLADRDLRKLTMNLTSNADEICKALLENLRKEYGPSDLGLIALGKWGGRELGLRSDLDFIFVSPTTEPTEKDIKIARRFLSRISEPHRGGSIYSIDLRLRPSGNAGAILVSQESLGEYLDTKAAAWERQAYLRARPLIELSFHPGERGARRGLNDADKAELKMIRDKLFVEGTHGDLDLKLSLGGLADVEFTAQIALLARGEFSLDPSTYGMIQYLESFDAEWKTVGPRLRDDYDFLRRIEQLYQLTTSQSGSKLRLKSAEFRRLALVLDQSPADLESCIRSAFERIDEALRGVRVL
jgi:glutamate-ammonia-ligase adenylyltransferase